jgi:hypothetical protein
LGTVTPAASASRTSSATDPARNFSMTRARWTLTVFSPMPSATAICLFSMPVTTHREIQRTVMDAEREALLRLRADGAIDDDVLRALERELDLEERRIDA